MNELGDIVSFWGDYVLVARDFDFSHFASVPLSWIKNHPDSYNPISIVFRLTEDDVPGDNKT